MVVDRDDGVAPDSRLGVREESVHAVSLGFPPVDTTELETIIYEKDGAIARIVLNTPEKANVQTWQQVKDM